MGNANRRVLCPAAGVPCRGMLKVRSMCGVCSDMGVSIGMALEGFLRCCKWTMPTSARFVPLQVRPVQACWTSVRVFLNNSLSLPTMLH